jgi:hypothetical protein
MPVFFGDTAIGFYNSSAHRKRLHGARSANSGKTSA